MRRIGPKGLGAVQRNLQTRDARLKNLRDKRRVHAGHQSHIDRALAEVRNDVDLRSARDGADAERGFSKDRVGFFRKDRRHLAAEAIDRGGDLINGIHALLGSRRMHSTASSFEMQPAGTLVRVDCIEGSRLPGHHKIEPLLFGERLGPVLAGLFADESREPDFVGQVSQKSLRLAQCPKHGSHRPLGITRASAP